MSMERREPASGLDHLQQRIAELHAKLRIATPSSLAVRTGAVYQPVGDDQGTFRLTLWSQDVSLSFPDFTGRNVQSGQLLSALDQALLAYYFTTSDGTPEAGRWISFSELPDGRFYTQAFQGYTGDSLARLIGNDEPGFVAAATEIGGRPLADYRSLGDYAFAFRALPQVLLLVACWLGDEDFSPSYRILFDAAVRHHLPTDACAILGSSLTRRLAEGYRRWLDQRESA